MAKDAIVEKAKYEIIGGYYSPVSDQYNKPGLAPAVHRVRMCELAVDQTSNWLMVDPWEASQPEYQRTAVVLEHFDHELNQGPNGGVQMRDGKKVKIVLLAGGDLIESFGAPGVWAPQDLHVILGRFGCLIIERTGSDVWAFLLSHDILYHHRCVTLSSYLPSPTHPGGGAFQEKRHCVSLRNQELLFLRTYPTVRFRYLLPNSVIQYIEDNRLYRGDEIDFAMSEVQLKSYVLECLTRRTPGYVDTVNTDSQ
ncbi:nicotinate-nucleotide adenylyltransferase [Rhizoctonia solani AG-1 IA]|uniref:Nicotinate-nucleotide adenylyltransferase n=1 Tax=Thanatephorus cucumeris (strain AG1-IA) TaxID=983506 RepID=L8WWQ9_THACA|nr:nicotinate-nucleotide adenylyltransferase [Rhizoctonia solani AG-1 IA]